MWHRTNEVLCAYLISLLSIEINSKFNFGKNIITKKIHYVLSGNNWWNSNGEKHSIKNVIPFSAHSFFLIYSHSNIVLYVILWTMMRWFHLFHAFCPIFHQFSFRFKDNDIPVIDADLIARQGNNNLAQCVSMNFEMFSFDYAIQ